MLEKSLILRAKTWIFKNNIGDTYWLNKTTLPINMLPSVYEYMYWLFLQLYLANPYFIIFCLRTIIKNSLETKAVDHSGLVVSTKRDPTSIYKKGKNIATD